MIPAPPIHTIHQSPKRTDSYYTPTQPRFFQPNMQWCNKSLIIDYSLACKWPFNENFKQVHLNADFGFHYLNSYLLFCSPDKCWTNLCPVNIEHYKHPRTQRHQLYSDLYLKQQNVLENTDEHPLQPLLFLNRVRNIQLKVEVKS